MFIADKIVPSTPTGLYYDSVVDFGFNVYWSPSQDNVAISHYDIYIDENFYIRTIPTYFSFGNMQRDKIYAINVEAVDICGNRSALSETLYVPFWIDTRNQYRYDSLSFTLCIQNLYADKSGSIQKEMNLSVISNSLSIESSISSNLFFQIDDRVVTKNNHNDSLPIFITFDNKYSSYTHYSGKYCSFDVFEISTLASNVSQNFNLNIYTNIDRFKFIKNENLYFSLQSESFSSMKESQHISDFYVEANSSIEFNNFAKKDLLFNIIDSTSKTKKVSFDQVVLLTNIENIFSQKTTSTDYLFNLDINNNVKITSFYQNSLDIFVNSKILREKKYYFETLLQPISIDIIERTIKKQTDSVLYFNKSNQNNIKNLTSNTLQIFTNSNKKIDLSINSSSLLFGVMSKRYSLKSYKKDISFTVDERYSLINKVNKELNGFIFDKKSFINKARKNMPLIVQTNQYNQFYLYYLEPDTQMFSQGTLYKTIGDSEKLILSTSVVREILENAEGDIDLSYNIKGDWIKEYWNNSRGYVYRSNFIKDNTTSTLYFEVNVPLNAFLAEFSMDYFVSSEQERDILSILIDSEPIEISGDIGWQKISTYFSRGYHFIEIIYGKDEEGQQYLDRACIDNISIKYSPIEYFGYRISEPIDLTPIINYQDSMIKWQYSVDDPQFKDNVFVKIDISFDNGSTWIEVENNKKIGAFVVGKNYEGKYLLIRERLYSYLNYTPKLTNVSLNLIGRKSI